MAKLIYLFCAFLIVGCQTDLSGEVQVVKGNSDLKTSDGILDLSQFSQEQQKVEREQAAKKREQLKAGRVVLEADSKVKIAANSVNLAVLLLLSFKESSFHDTCQVLRLVRTVVYCCNR